MPTALPRRALLLAPLALAACGDRRPASGPRPGDLPLHENETPALRALIDRAADSYGVPRRLVHRIIADESRHRPGARNGPYWGLMQLLPQTARTMGFDGPPEALLDAETNLRYGVKYLRGAWIVADGSEDAAVAWYRRGYYYEARRRGLLEETGLRG